MLDENSHANETSAHLNRVSPLTRFSHHIEKGAALNADFALVCRGYHIRIANHDKKLKRLAEGLVNRLYQTRGLTPPTPQAGAGKPAQITLASCRQTKVFGTLTLGVDTGGGLLADGLYRDEIDAFRSKGRHVVEVTQLAMARDGNSSDALARIFNLAFITARHVHGATDAFIEVHPRHAEFYARKLGYERIGSERVCPRVGAPAVLMHLCLSSIDQRIHRLSHQESVTDRSLYRRFMTPTEQASVVEQLRVTPEDTQTMNS